MSGQPIQQVHYSALNQPSMGSNIRATMNNLKETGIYLLKAVCSILENEEKFTQTFIYEKYNVIMCGIITMCCLAYLFKST